jgi:hypothetical protein
MVIEDGLTLEHRRENLLPNTSDENARKTVGD